MRKIKLYIAISLDGKIAKPDGGVGWLDEFNAEGEDYGYKEFMNSVDTTIMGNNTYKQVLEFGADFPYWDKRNYVFTKDPGLKEDENVKYVSNDHASFVRGLKEEDGGDIWLIGGGKVNSFFINNGFIDELIVFIMPRILGDGIPLFETLNGEVAIDLVKVKTYLNGVTALNYKTRNA